MDEKADFSGYLKKRGVKLKIYRNRWFELRGTTLYYFRSKKNKTPAGVVELGSDVILDINEKKKNCFKIKSSGLKRDLFISADKKVTMDQWLEVLKAVRKSESSESKVVEPEQETIGLFSRDEPNRKVIDVTCDDFELLKVVGRGSLGKILKVRKRDTGEIFAMKIQKKEMIIKENMVDYTITEKQILELVNHPFVVRLHYT